MYVVIVAGAIIGAILGYCFKDPILIGGTSLMGSYVFVTGIGFFIKEIPSVMDIYDLIKKGDYSV